jgi:hypothetical protein
MSSTAENMNMCKIPCERSPKLGSSWWKNLGYDSPCGCAFTRLAYLEKEKNKTVLDKISETHLNMLNNIAKGISDEYRDMSDK